MVKNRRHWFRWVLFHFPGQSILQNDTYGSLDFNFLVEIKVFSTKPQKKSHHFLPGGPCSKPGHLDSCLAFRLGSRLVGERRYIVLSGQVAAGETEIFDRTRIARRARGGLPSVGLWWSFSGIRRKKRKEEWLKPLLVLVILENTRYEWS